jgi:ubiquinone/menaquinone biosynthesis C-methylase UbiE
VANTFKKSRIKAIDLSEDYISFCNRSHEKLKSVSFVVGAGEDLSGVKSGSQDAWYSTYMFHELPKDIRIQMIQEAFRVLKPGGGIFIADSIQVHDRPDLKPIIDLFPQNFHEPYYKNYSITPLEGLLTDGGFENSQSYSGFVTKVAWAQKPL